MVAPLLFNPKVTHILSKLDDSTSMFSIAMRDGVDNTGRTIMEYKRSPHGGRERLIEEVLTTLIWGFGINILKNKVYDPIFRKNTPIKFPDADMSLLAKESTQHLTTEMAQKFEAAFPKAYEGLTEMVTSPAMKKWYHASNVGKFMFCTGIPVLLISLGIPTLNQWLTRKKLSQENTALDLNQNPQFGNPSFAKPSLFQIFDEAQSGKPTLGGPVQFAGALGSGATLAAEGISHLLQNERANTLVVDGMLSGGRFYKGRNPVEKAEIAFRELSIIGFLYYAQRPIQNFFQKQFDKYFGTFSRIDFTGLAHLKEQFKTPTEGTIGRNLSDEFKTSFQSLSEKIKATNPNLVESILKSSTADKEVEAALVQVIREYAISGAKDNLILETAKKCNWIPTLSHEGAGSILDVTKKIQTEPILHFIESLTGLTQKLETNGLGALEKLLTKSYGGRVGAFVAANAVCALFLSYICPKLQHYITYKITGKDHFPGTDKVISK